MLCSVFFHFFSLLYLPVDGEHQLQPSLHLRKYISKAEAWKNCLGWQIEFGVQGAAAPGQGPTGHDASVGGPEAVEY